MPPQANITRRTAGEIRMQQPMGRLKLLALPLPSIAPSVSYRIGAACHPKTSQVKGEDECKGDGVRDVDVAKGVSGRRVDRPELVLSFAYHALAQVPLVVVAGRGSGGASSAIYSQTGASLNSQHRPEASAGNSN